ncbi:MAG TPA: nitroreductase family deazaflavin-dependent oxidoreductase [Streptosporangiaceae bacterium]|jgi:deazaflavin-dependent oxidoreductase (nitroreductase family)|nr:nitroreductase family deazaflavin-dependent oxidoreductase [Streptosporangiaceae bacterium]
MTEPNDFNAKIIEEFRANGGKVGGMFAGSSLLLLHSTGAKTGAERVSPLAYQKVGDSYAIFASKAGAPTNPAWYHNLLADPRTRAEVGTETIEVTARVAGPEEREAIWARQKENFPNFAEYEKKTQRQIPVVILEPVR